MKALVCHQNADDIGSVRIEDFALPVLGAGDVRLRVRAASVNFPDLLMIQGKYQHKPQLPFVVGGELAGDVIATGADVSDLKIGDRVMGGAFSGGFAQEAQVPARALRKIPDGTDYATAAGFTTAYLTAYVSLVRRGQLQKDEWLLVHGAAGGVGLAAVDIGLTLGAKIIATASSGEKRSFLKKYGAHHVLPSSGFREQVKELTNGGAEVIYDPVGGDAFDESVRCIGFNGRLLVVGFASGRIPTIGANMPLIKGFSVVGVRAGEYGRKFPDKGRENIAAIDALLAQKKLRPHVCAHFPLKQAVEAMRMLADRKAIGKVVIEP